MNKCNFSGWAIKTDLEYAAERIIHQDAFSKDGGNTVPLLWMHGDYTRENMLGYAFLQNKDEGVYAYCMFNNTDIARRVKELIRRGDICALSVHATGIEQDHGIILRGSIKEVSLVLTGANPGAFINCMDIQHGDDVATEAFIYTEVGISRKHADVPECF